MAVSLTSGVFIAERKQGLLDRCLVAGTTTWNNLNQLFKKNQLITISYRRTDEGNITWPVNQPVYRYGGPNSSGFHVHVIDL